MKYRKKPVEIEAIQYNYSNRGILNQFDSLKWLKTAYDKDIIFFDTDTQDYYIETLEGNMKVSDGDWIIQGVNGELYPCKDDIFRKTYEFLDGSEI